MKWKWSSSASFLVGRTRKQFLVVKNEELKEDIVKTILETPDEDLEKALQEAGLEGEGAGALVGAAKALQGLQRRPSRERNCDPGEMCGACLT